MFISQLETARCSDALRGELEALCAALPAGASGLDWLLGAATWPAADFQVYERLRAESEYAAWVAAFGIRANHFTVHTPTTTCPASRGSPS